MIEIVHFLRETGGSHAGKCSEVANKMRLVGEVEGGGYVGQPGKAPSLDQAYRFIKPLHTQVDLGRKAHRLGKPSFKLSFGNMQRGQQISDVQGTDVGVDQMEAFFHQRISRFLLPQLAHQEAGKKGQLFLLVSGFQQLAGSVFFPELVKIRPSRSQGGGIDSKERFQRIGLENNLDSRKRWIRRWARRGTRVEG